VRVRVAPANGDITIYMTNPSEDQNPKTTENRSQAPGRPRRKWLRRTTLGLAVFVTLIGGAVAALELRSPNMRPLDPNKRLAVTDQRIARGRYIVEAEAHCMQCHSDRDWNKHGAPVRPGLAGAGWDVPWVDNGMPGPVFAPNLTPDPETGIGKISDDAIARAIREGVSHDGRALFMMPWQDYRHLSDEDVASIVVYLRTLPPVKKARGTTAINAPVRWFLKAAPTPLTAPIADTTTSDPIARGKHLAEVGQCRSCHTPVDARHQPLPGMDFSGGQEFVVGGVKYRATNITPDASGISYYNEALFIQAMRTGMVGGRRLAPIMPWSEIGKLTDQDLSALWAYLKTVKPIAHDVPRTEVAIAD
jgi:mono/diheme cytochrome c family protein